MNATRAIQHIESKKIEDKLMGNGEHWCQQIVAVLPAPTFFAKAK